MKTETKTGASSERIANLSPSKLELLARRLREKEGREQGRARIPRRAGSAREPHAPLSFDQERLWFIDQLETGHAVNNAPDGLVLEGRLRVAALEQALGEVVRRHEILRTTFQMSGGELVQVVAPCNPLRLPLIDLGGLPAGERQECVRRLAEAEERRHFDLARGPLLRAALLRLDEQTHVLLLTAHHAVCDAWSMSVLNRELAGLYQAYVQGTPSTLSELPIQFADFAAWQRANLQGEPLKRLLNYWHKQLAGAPALIDLPTDKPRPALQNYSGAAESLELSETLSRSLQELSRESGVTLFMTMLAAFKVLLGGYTGARDIVVGTPVGGRNQLETEPLIGLFINTLVMRTDLGGDPTFRELLGRVSEVTLGALAHRDLPFERLVHDLQPVRALSHTPLFQVMFDLQRPVSVATSLPGLRIRSLGSPSQFAKFDLTMYVTENPDRLTLTLQYNTELFEAETVRRMLGHTRNLLESAVANPRRRLSELSLLGADERHRILVRWNETEADYGASATLHELFEAQAGRTPDRAALVFEGESLTYDELNRRANRLAHFLRAEGVAPDSLVAVCAERSFEMVVALLAVLKAGGAYLPLDPEYPSERLAFMLSDARAPLLLTQRKLLPTLPPTGARLVLLDADPPLVARHCDENPANVVEGRNLAYVIYTSGSTGRPKGVMIHHEGLCNRLLWMQEQYRLDADDRVLQKTPFSFDVSGWEFFWPLITGATLVVARPEGHREPAYLLELINRERLTTVHFVPSMLAAFLEQPGLERLPGLRRVICSGEALGYELQERFFAQVSGVELHNLYGPTEASIDVTYWQCRAGEGARGGVPIGRPIANTEMYVLDAHLAPVPAGVAGELYIGGVGLGRGYLNRPALTAERFVPHPYGNRPGTRLYRTGDVGRHRSDAAIEYLGRTDHQVKVRGFRIELGEIEAALTEQPSVREAVVTAEKMDAAGRTRLVAYLVCEREGEAADVEELRRSLKERLPEYMVPSAFAFLEELPLSPNGKVDRGALPALQNGAAGAAREYVGASTAAEEVLCGIWQEVLGVERVGIHDNFFELGGDSIISVRIISKAAQSGLHFTLRQLFQHQTVAELVAVAGAGVVSEAEQGIVVGTVPLTPVQNWFFESEPLDPQHFNQALLLEVKETLDAGLLQRSVEHLYAHHDALRLRFERAPEGWRQFNADSVPPDYFHVADISGLDEAAQPGSITDTAARVQGSFDLSQGPLFKVVLFDLGAGRAGRLLLVAHHLVIDGVSWRILLDDLQTVYLQLSRGEEINLGPKTGSFKQWAERLAEYARSGKAEADYWLDAISHDAEPLPVDRAGENTVASTGTVSVELDAEETRALIQQVPAVYHTQIDEVLLAALARSFDQWGVRRLLVDVEGHGRDEQLVDLNLSRTVGWFTAIYPLLFETGAGAWPDGVLNNVKEQVRAVPQRGIGYGLLRYLGAEDVAARMRAAPPAEVSFNYLGQLDQALAGSDMFGAAREAAGASQSLRERRRYLIEVSGSVLGGRLRMVWTYSENLHHATTVEALAAGFADALRTLVARCQSTDEDGFALSNFADFGWSPDDLADIISKIEKSIGAN